MAGPGKPGPECGISRLLSLVNDDNAEVVQMVLDDKDGTPAPLAAQAFTELLQHFEPNSWIHYSTVKNHRRGECRCAREKAA